MLDIPSEQVLVNDDVASTYVEHSAGRRGVAGTIVVQKIAGAAAQSGASLSECKRLGDKANQSTATFGVALSSCHVPGAAATFEIGPAEMEVGVGLHGEPGQQRSLMATADQVVGMMLKPVAQDLQLKAGRLSFPRPCSCPIRARWCASWRLKCCKRWAFSNAGLIG
jgi:dihydroxyacetone kinase-like protein